MERFELKHCMIWDLDDKEDDVVNGRQATLMFQREDKCSSWFGHSDSNEFSWEVAGQSTCHRKRSNVYLLNVCRKGEDRRERILLIVPEEHSKRTEQAESSDGCESAVEMLERIYSERGLFQDNENEDPAAMSANILEEGTIDTLEAGGDSPSFVATSIAKAGQVVAAGIISGAELASTAISRGGSFIESRITPSEESIEVPIEVQSGIIKAKTFSKSVSDASAEIVNTAGVFAADLARNLSNGMNRNIDHDVDSSQANKRSQALKTAKEVAAAALSAAGSISQAVTIGARKVCSSTAEATSAIAKARHGEEVGEAVDNALCAAGNALDTALAARHMTIRATSKAALIGVMSNNPNTGYHIVGTDEKSNGDDDDDDGYMLVNKNSIDQGPHLIKEEPSHELPNVVREPSANRLLSGLPDPPSE